MALESERKYMVQDLKALRRRLAETQHATLLGEYFESNQIYDWPERTLWQQQKLLRVRTGKQSVICLKSSPQDASGQGVKLWQETQTEVGSAAEMAHLLEQLGLRAVLEYEKIRSKWQWGACVLCLDRVPFGRYVEIEGDAAAIDQCAQHFALDPQSATTASYHELNPGAGAKGSLNGFISFTFEEPERSHYLQICENGNVESCL